LAQSQAHDGEPRGAGGKEVLGRFSLDEEIARFAPAPNQSGRRAETLIKTDGLRVVLVTMHAGIMLHDHVAPGPITIQALRGRFAIRVNGEEHELPAGELIAIETGVRHAVEAREEGAFLLTIGGTGAAPTAEGLGDTG